MILWPVGSAVVRRREGWGRMSKALQNWVVAQQRLIVWAVWMIFNIAIINKMISYNMMPDQESVWNMIWFSMLFVPPYIIVALVNRVTGNQRAEGDDA